MPIFFTTSTDGNNTEGIGSVAQHCLLLIGLAKKFHLNYCFAEFSNIAHWQHSNFSNQEFSQIYTNFFNFPAIPENYYKKNFNFDNLLYEFIKQNYNSETNYLIEFTRQQILNEAFQNINYFFQNQSIISIKNNFKCNLMPFDENFLNVAIHVRRKNLTDLSNIKLWSKSDGPWEQDDWREMYQTEKEAELFTNKKSNFYRYTNLFDFLNKKYEKFPTLFHIFSEGNLDDFKNFENLILPNHNIEFHLNNHPTHDLFYSINADCLIMANSAFSYMAGLLNSKTKIISENFGQPCYPGTIYLNKDYNVIF